MKILMVLPTAFPVNRGTPARVFEMSRVLYQKGLDISIACYNEGKETLTDIKIFRIPKLPFYKKGIGPGYGRIILDIFLFFNVLIVTYTKKIDILHCHLHEGALIGLLVGRLLKKPVIFDIHSSLEKELIEQKFTEKVSVIQKIAHFLDRKLPAWVDFNIVISENLLDYYRKIDSNLKLLKVPNATDTKFFKPMESKLKNELHLVNNIVVGYQGNMSNLQNLDLLVETAEVVMESESNVVFLIGYTSDPCNVKKLVYKYKLNNHFIFIPAPLEKAPDVINCCDIMVIPRNEPYGVPMKLLNFMACGKPVILNWNLIRGLTHEENISGLFGFSDKNDLVQVLLSQIHFNDIRNAYSDSLINYVNKEFSYDSLYKKLTGVYSAIVLFDSVKTGINIL